jgi:RNA polymerase sigma-70 factor, ECF subfamily
MTYDAGRGGSLLEDRTLLARVAGGDQSAVGDLYDCYGRQVYSLALRVTRDAATADDVTQDVFVKVWQHAGRFDPERGRAATWILHIAYTTAVDVVRARARGGPPRFEPLQEGPDAEADTMAAAETALLAEQVRRALMRLPPEQRQVTEMAYFGALSHSEIALATGIPLGTVKSRLRLAMDALRQFMLSPVGKEVKPDAGMSPRG